MSSAAVHYTIALPSTEPTVEPSGVFEVDVDGKLTVGSLRESWPFEGPFHFRARVATPDGSYVFLDLPSSDASVVPPLGDVYVIRALPLFDVAQPASAHDATDFELLPAQYDALVRRRNAVRGDEPFSIERNPIRFAAGDDTSHATSPRSAPGGAAATPPAANDDGVWDAQQDFTDSDAQPSHRGGGVVVGTSSYASGGSSSASGSSAPSQLLRGLGKLAAKAQEKAAAALEKAAAAADKAMDSVEATAKKSTASGTGGGSTGKSMFGAISKGLGAAIGSATAAAAAASASVQGAVASASAHANNAAAPADRDVGHPAGHVTLDEEDD